MNTTESELDRLVAEEKRAMNARTVDPAPGLERLLAARNAGGLGSAPVVVGLAVVLLALGGAGIAWSRHARTPPTEAPSVAGPPGPARAPRSDFDAPSSANVTNSTAPSSANVTNPALPSSANVTNATGTATANAVDPSPVRALRDREDSTGSRPATEPPPTSPATAEGAPAPAVVPEAPPAVPEAPRDSLAAELALLRAAQQALRSGDTDAALALTRRHAVEFPEGALGPERRALERRIRCYAPEGTEAPAGCP